MQGNNFLQGKFVEKNLIYFTISEYFIKKIAAYFHIIVEKRLYLIVSLW